LSYETESIHLVKNEQQMDRYKNLNPSQLVPTLIDEDNIFTIDEYFRVFGRTISNQSLLPKNLVERAKVRAFSQAIACDIHPLNNLRVLKYLNNELAITDQQKNDWYTHWFSKALKV
jgi:glutathione S-transferase